MAPDQLRQQALCLRADLDARAPDRLFAREEKLSGTDLLPIVLHWFLTAFFPLPVSTAVLFRGSDGGHFDDCPHLH